MGGISNLNINLDPNSLFLDGNKEPSLFDSSFKNSNPSIFNTGFTKSPEPVAPSTDPTTVNGKANTDAYESLLKGNTIGTDGNFSTSSADLKKIFENAPGFQKIINNLNPETARDLLSFLNKGMFEIPISPLNNIGGKIEAKGSLPKTVPIGSELPGKVDFKLTLPTGNPNYAKNPDGSNSIDPKTGKPIETNQSKFTYEFGSGKNDFGATVAGGKNGNSSTTANIKFDKNGISGGGLDYTEGTGDNVKINGSLTSGKDGTVLGARLSNLVIDKNTKFNAGLTQNLTNGQTGVDGKVTLGKDDADTKAIFNVGTDGKNSQAGIFFSQLFGGASGSSNPNRSVLTPDTSMGITKDGLIIKDGSFLNKNNIVDPSLITPQTTSIFNDKNGLFNTYRIPNEVTIDGTPIVD